MRGSFPHVISTCESDPKEKKKERIKKGEIGTNKGTNKGRKGRKLGNKGMKKKKEESVEREREILSSL